MIQSTGIFSAHGAPWRVGYLALLGLCGCAVGPDYHRPSASSSAQFKETGDWKPSEPDGLLSHGPWWSIFNDPALDALEQQIDVSNQNLKAAQDSYRQARALVTEARAGYWPIVAASIGRERGQQQPGLPTQTDNIASGSVSWNIDIWGQTRRTVEADVASANASGAAVAAARLLAQATLAVDYFSLRAQDSLKTLLDDTVTDEQRSLKITQNRYAYGVAAKADVVTAQTQLLSSQAQHINAAIARAQLEHAIAVLIGKAPADFSLGSAPLRTDVPTAPAGLPSQLLERRPDVAQAERRMAAANAQIGVATAAYFPTLTLSATDTYAAAGPLRDLIGASDRIWAIGPTLAGTLFDAGARHAQVVQARAAYDVTVDNYRQAVLSSFQQVEDNLVALRVLEQEAVVEDSTVSAAKEAERLTLNQYQAGTVPYTSVITAQTTTLASEQTALSVQLNRLTASISLIEAIGGGWDPSQLR